MLALKQPCLALQRPLSLLAVVELLARLYSR
jgi:hypothetical protein